MHKIMRAKRVTKLWKILLMEADLNFGNKRTYGVRMLDNDHTYGLMSEEISIKRNHTVDDDTLSRVIFFDIIHQSRLPAGMGSVNTASFYDRVAHATTLVVFQVFVCKGEDVCIDAESYFRYEILPVYGIWRLNQLSGQHY